MDNLARLHLSHFGQVLSHADMTRGLFDYQAEVLESTERFKALVCGRRGGKTTMDARLLLDAAERNPQIGEDESISAYIAPTKNQAKRLMWGRLQTVAQKFKIQIKPNATDLIITHRNGHQIWLMGADDNRDVDRLRGFPYRRVVIDEAQAVGADFDELVDDVLDPALADYNGDLILTGTPNASCVGYFHDATTGQLLDSEGVSQWRTWTWTVLDNPFFPLWRGQANWREMAREWLAEKRRKKGWTEGAPTYQREWLGRWVRDMGSLVYRYDPARNDYDELPKGHDWNHVLAMDLGTRDAFALSVLAYSRTSPDLYLVDDAKWPGLSVSGWVTKIKLWRDKYKPIHTVGDAGALGKAIIDDINERYHLGIEYAEKRKKLAAIEQVNSDFQARRYFVKRKSKAAGEMALIQWDDSRIKEDPRFPNDASDSQLYGFRKAAHYRYELPEVLPPVGSEGHAKIIQAAMKEERRRKVAEANGTRRRRRRRRG